MRGAQVQSDRWVATVQEQAKAVISCYGGVRPAARTIGMDPGYLWRLAAGKKKNPSEETLRKLCLRGPIYYTQAAVFEPDDFALDRRNHG